MFARWQNDNTHRNRTRKSKSNRLHQRDNKNIGEVHKHTGGYENWLTKKN